MLNLYTLATGVSALVDMIRLDKALSYTPVNFARPGMNMPVILFEGGKKNLISAHWGCMTEAATMPLSSFPMEKILTQPPFNRWIHTQRCIIPANCFFTRLPEHREYDTYLIRLLQTRIFLMGGLYMTEVRHGKTCHSFLLLTTQSADVLQTLTPQMPVIISTDHADSWLHSEHLIDIMEIADTSGDHWFDYYPVSDRIIQPGEQDKKLLRPLGPSKHEAEAHAHKLKAVDVRQDRFDRRGGKR